MNRIKTILVLWALLASGCMSAPVHFLDDQANRVHGGLYRVVLEVHNQSLGSALETPLVHGVWVTHRKGEPMYTRGLYDGGSGLEALVEDGYYWSFVDYLRLVPTVQNVGIVRDSASSMVLPEQKDRIMTAQFFVTERDRLSFVLPLMQFNAAFIATPEEGLALFSKGRSLSGDITSMLGVYHAGTEAIQPFNSPDQMLRQAEEGVGEQTYEPVSALDVRAGAIVKVKLRVESVDDTTRFETTLRP